MMVKKYKAPAAEKLLDILELMAQHNKGFSLTELSTTLNIPGNSVFRIMKELESKNYIYKDLMNNSYQLTGKLYYLGSSIANRIKLRTVALEAMQSLLTFTRETTILTKLGDQYSTLIIDQLESPEPIKFLSTIGLLYPSHSSAMGKAMLAFLSESSINEYLSNSSLSPSTANTITDRELLLQELQKIRTNGYAIDNEESCIGLKCIAAPIFNNKGSIEGAIGISAPLFRLTDDKLDSYINKIVDQTTEVSSLMGFHAAGHPFSALSLNH
jgi:DNA-binding IclR family transcriptional regulator